MDKILVQTDNTLGKNFVPQDFLSEGKDEYYYRNQDTYWPSNHWRPLTKDEIDLLIKNGNQAANWNSVLVAHEFDCNQLKNNMFYGLVRIGRIKNEILHHQGLKLPAGITNSLIISCDIGDDPALHNVHYLAHYIIGDRCLLFNIDEMLVTNSAKFGNGIIKQGESETDLIWVDLINEAGGRGILPFDGITTADAYLWAKYRDDKNLQENLKNITQSRYDNHRGYYGKIGHKGVIKNTRSIIDVKTGESLFIHGAHKLQNMTINSSMEEPSRIGEGVEAENGIIGYGSQILSGTKVERIIMGNHATIKYGARVFDTYLGDNSTIACCEVLNNLLFPAHEQHHNNSFLIASLIMGQSNLAAGATIGSNHNSRANDNEIQAGRGFWPGLCSSVKHYSRFASFVLLAKADYPYELDVSLPFSLINNNVSKDQLEVMPAYWWLYNMYALARNTWKFQNRDQRIKISQHIEYDYLAPDTVEEIINACRLLEIWTAKARLRHQGTLPTNPDEVELEKLGAELLSNNEAIVNKLDITSENIEKSRRKVVLIKTFRAYHAYTDMLYLYAIKNLINYLKTNPKADLKSMNNSLECERKSRWVNLGGQIVPAGDVDQLRTDIGNGRLKSWDEIHKRYDELWIKYPLEKQKHAYAVLCYLLRTNSISKGQWNSVLDRAVTIEEFINKQVYITRKKDYDSPFSQITFRNPEEMAAVNGSPEENSFVKQIQQDTEAFKKSVSKVRI